jgi:tetratricopeptide (TPR) repeat protein
MNRLPIIISFVVAVFLGCNRDNTELYNQACDLEKQGEFKKAIELLTKALEINPKDLECYNNRAWDYYDLGELGNAMSDFESILKIDSINTAGIYGIGFLYYEQGYYQKAIDKFDKVIKLKGGGPIFLEMTDNEFLGQRAPLKADINQVYHFKRLAESKLSTSPNNVYTK